MRNVDFYHHFDIQAQNAHYLLVTNNEKCEVYQIMKLKLRFFINLQKRKPAKE